MTTASGIPARRLAVVACMDARLQPEQLLGLRRGDAHVIRNAGGVVTDDVIRSLLISQRLLETQEIVLIHHTECGMTKLDEDQVWSAVEHETGIRPPFALEAFADAEADVVQSIARIRASPFILHTAAVRGYLYDVATGAMHEVTPDSGTAPS